MNWRDHYRLKGQHAFLGASNYSWLKYDEEKLRSAYINYLASSRGTLLHAFAAQCIELRQKLPRSKKTLNAYVNDCIGFGMKPELILYYSENCFGTADAIGFDGKTLRIFDLKTGLVTPAKFDQLLIYDALFCLEYEVKPQDISFENRIYQFDDVQIITPESEQIATVCNKIITSDKIIQKLKEEAA